MVRYSPQARLSPMFLIAIILCLVTTAACQQQDQQSTTFQKASGVDKFGGMKDATIQSVKNISTYHAKDAYDEIVANLERFHALYKKVQKVEQTDSIINDIAGTLSDIAKSYRKIASMETDITQLFGKESSKLKSTHRTTGDVIKNIDAEIANYNKNISTLEQELQSEPNTTEKDKKEVSVRGYRSIIKSLEGRKLIWVKFSDYQDEILKKLGTNSEKIGLLFHTLKINAEVYEQAAETLRLRKSAIDALGNLFGLANIEGLVVDIVYTWGLVDDMVLKISSSDFNLEAAKPGM